MKEAARQTRSYLMAMFEHHGFNPRTDLGQNFLIDLNILDYVVEHAELSSNDVVLEVGAGTGGMTAFLAQQAGAVVSVELDRNMHRLAESATDGFENLELLNQDVLKNKNQLAPEVVDRLQHHLAAAPQRRLKLVANLPYSVATPVISNLVATELPWCRMVVTIQLELAERMVARPGKRKYGSLAVWLQSQCDVKLLKRLPPNVFWPRPKVNSAIVRLKPRADKAARIADRSFFQDFLRRLFHQRRKLLRSVLVGMYRRELSKSEVDQVLAAAGMREKQRAEQLSVSRLIELSNCFHTAIHTSESPVQTGQFDDSGSIDGNGSTDAGGSEEGKDQ